jgi:Zn-dependent M28 family amino/carboxypeptidase
LIPIIAFSQDPASPLSLIWGVITGCLTFIKILNFNGNKSVGALDNASGVAQLYHLAREVNKKPLNNLHLTLVATDAEELGNMGAHAFLRAFKDKYPKKTTKFLIIDSIGCKDNNTIVYGVGIPIKHYSLSLEKLIREELDISGVPLIMQALPPFIEISSDHVPVHKAGYDLIWFTSISINFHTKNDTIAYYR